jgi:phage I-like protein
MFKFILKEISSAPGEFQLLPAGEISIEGEPPVFLDESAAKSVIDAFEGRGNDMVIDYEHQTLKDVEAPAAGWIKRLVFKGQEGLWAAVEWTEKAKSYLTSREYRYFSPVFLITKGDRKVVRIEHVALTNYPKLNQLKPIMAKNFKTFEKEEGTMIKKLKQLLALADDAGEDQVFGALEALVNKNKELEQRTEPVACKEVLEALGAKAEASAADLLQIVAGLKAPASAAVELSQEVARLKTKIAEIEQEDLVALALKEGKTSPDELAKWARDLALKSPEQFRLIVLSRPVGSVIPVDGIHHAPERHDPVLDEVQRQVNKMLGVDEETFKKYNKV